MMWIVVYTKRGDAIRETTPFADKRDAERRAIFLRVNDIADLGSVRVEPWAANAG